MTSILDDTSRFQSLAALRAAHLALLSRQRTETNSSDLLFEADEFLRRGVATGALLDDDEERWAAQGLLDYWATVIVRAGREPGDTSLADFEADLAPEINDDLRPYIGLDAFREPDQNLFFGRQRLVNELVEQLKTQRFLAIVGPSGSGKSSLVRAGLIPALQHGALTLGGGEIKDILLRSIYDKLLEDEEPDPQLSSNQWRYLAPLMPGSEPIAALARTLLAWDRELADDEHQLVLQLRKDESTLWRLVGGDKALPVVLVIDQFEEVFTLCDYPYMREAFIDNLLYLTQTPGVRHTVIITMRSDFEPFVARSPTLLPIFEQARVQMPPLSASELRDAIEKPAEQVGLKFEAGVVDALLQDILGEPAALPLLQFTLLKLWETRDHNRVTWESYKQVGGGRLALARSADTLFDALIPEEQVTARRILLRMVRTGEGLEMTSNRVRREMLYRAGEDPGRVDRVLNKLIAARLVRVTEGETEADQQLEVAHEALVRNWPRLTQWLESEKTAIATRRRLEGRAAEWVRLGQGDGGLLDEVELREAEHWLRSAEAAYLGYEPILDALVSASENYVHRVEQERASVHARELENARALAEEQQRRVEEQQHRVVEQEAANERLRIAGRRIRVALAAALILALVAIVFAVQSWRNANEAKRNFVQAQAQQQTAVAAGQVAQAQQQTAVAAGQIAQAQQQTAVAASQQAEIQRSTAVAAQQTAIAEGLRVQTQARLAQAGQLAAQAQSVLTQEPQRALLLAVEAVKLTQIQNQPPALVALDMLRAITAATSGRGLAGHAAPVLAVAASPNGHWLASGSADQTVRLWDLTANDPKANARVLSGHTTAVRLLSISPDSRWLVSASDDLTVRVWDLTASDPAASVRMINGHTGKINTLTISPDSRWLATGSADKSVRLWDLTSSDPNTQARVLAGSDGHSSAVTCLAFSANGRWLVSAGDDRTARVWNVEGNAPGEFRGLFRYRGLISAIAINPQSDVLVIGGAEDTRVRQSRVEVWTLSGDGTDHFIGLLSGNQGAVTSMAFSADKRWLVTVSTDRTAKLWDAGTINTPDPRAFLLSGHEAVITSINISADGHWLVTASADKTARLWDLTAGDPAASVRILRGADGALNAAVISANAKLATGSNDTSVRLWALPLSDRASEAAHASANELIALACRTAGRNLTNEEWTTMIPGREYQATCGP